MLQTHSLMPLWCSSGLAMFLHLYLPSMMDRLAMRGVGVVPLATLVVCINELLSSRALLNGMDDRVDEGCHVTCGLN